MFPDVCLVYDTNKRGVMGAKRLSRTTIICKGNVWAWNRSMVSSQIAFIIAFKVSIDHCYATSPSCCWGLVFAGSSPLMTTHTILSALLHIPGSKHNAAVNVTGRDASFLPRRAHAINRHNNPHAGTQFRWPPPFITTRIHCRGFSLETAVGKDNSR